MCEYCENKKPIVENLMYIDKTTKELFVDHFDFISEFRIKINFCPMCGADLRKET